MFDVLEEGKASRSITKEQLLSEFGDYIDERLLVKNLARVVIQITDERTVMIEVSE